MAQSTKSLSFANTSDVVTFGTAPSRSGTQPFSISCWVKPTSGSTSGYRSTVALSNSDFGLYLNSLKIDFYMSGDHTAAASVTAAVWSHIGVTFDGTTLKLWLNGTQDANTFTGISYSAWSSVRMGQSGGSSGLIGLLDDVAIWTSDQSANMPGLASGATDPSTLSPVRLWRLEEGSGTTTADTSGNSDTGTLSGPTWSTDVPSALAGGGGGGSAVGADALHYYRTHVMRGAA